MGFLGYVDEENGWWVRWSLHFLHRSGPFRVYPAGLRSFKPNSCTHRPNRMNRAGLEGFGFLRRCPRITEEDGGVLKIVVN